jgi:hypothetical protein
MTLELAQREKESDPALRTNLSKTPAVTLCRMAIKARCKAVSSMFRFEWTRARVARNFHQLCRSPERPGGTKRFS